MESILESILSLTESILRPPGNRISMKQCMESILTLMESILCPVFAVFSNLKHFGLVPLEIYQFETLLNLISSMKKLVKTCLKCVCVFER